MIVAFADQTQIPTNVPCYIHQKYKSPWVAKIFHVDIYETLGESTYSIIYLRHTKPPDLFRAQVIRLLQTVRIREYLLQAVAVGN